MRSIGLEMFYIYGTMFALITMGGGIHSKSENIGEIHISERIFSRWDVCFFFPVLVDFPKTEKKSKLCLGGLFLSVELFDDGIGRVVIFCRPIFCFSKSKDG